MSGIKCQLCDGFIYNGRCKVCGMPYRNDEILYHLNENSRDHYKHATPKAKEIMRQSRVPAGDSRVMSKEQIKVQQEKVRQEAMAKINSAKAPEKKSVAMKQKNKKGKSSIWWIIVFIYLFVGFISKEL